MIIYNNKIDKALMNESDSKWDDLIAIARNNGFILNSVHSPDGCYSYTKEIKNGECEISLGEEEQKALDMAMNHEMRGRKS